MTSPVMVFLIFGDHFCPMGGSGDMSSSLFLWVGTKNNLLRSIVEQIAAKELNMSLEARVDADGLSVYSLVWPDWSPVAGLHNDEE